MSSYLKNHWLGKQSLKQSLILNGLMPLAVLLTVQHTLLEPLTLNNTSLRLPLLLVMAILYLTLITMAVVSVNRKTRIQDTLIYSAGYHVMACNTLLFMAACVAAINLVDINTHGVKTETTIKQAFTAIALSKDKTTPGHHRLSGAITPSSPRLLQQYLQQHPDLTTLILSSTGGNIFAARAMANAIKVRGINTHVNDQCFSACTLIFIGGKQRSANSSAQLGFHGYQYHLADPNLYGAVQDQEQKDAQFFANQGVPTGFIEKMFRTRPPDLWKPTTQELLTANILHTTVELVPHPAF